MRMIGLPPEPEFRARPIDDWPPSAVLAWVHAQNLMRDLGPTRVLFFWDARVGTVTDR